MASILSRPQCIKFDMSNDAPWRMITTTTTTMELASMSGMGYVGIIIYVYIHVLLIEAFSIFCEIALRWLSQDLINHK